MYQVEPIPAFPPRSITFSNTKIPRICAWKQVDSLHTRLSDTSNNDGSGIPPSGKNPFSTNKESDGKDASAPHIHPWWGGGESSLCTCNSSRREKLGTVNWGWMGTVVLENAWTKQADPICLSWRYWTSRLLSVWRVRLCILEGIWDFYPEEWQQNRKEERSSEKVIANMGWWFATLKTDYFRGNIRKEGFLNSRWI